MLGAAYSNQEQILHQIFQLDKNIRFGAICNKFGEITAKLLRDGITLHLNEYETSKLLREAAGSWHYRHQLSYKLGQGHFALAVYDKLIRLTVPLDQENLMLLTLESYDNIPELVENVHNIIKNGNNS